MAAGNYDIFVEQGTTFTLYLNYKNTGGSSINLSGYTGEMQVRRQSPPNFYCKSLVLVSPAEVPLGSGLPVIPFKEFSVLEAFQ